jgi:hypothetical protein
MTITHGLESVMIAALSAPKPSKFDANGQYRGVCIQRQSGTEEWLNVSSTDPVWPHLAKGERFLLFLTEKGSRRLATIPTAEPAPVHHPLGFQPPIEEALTPAVNQPKGVQADSTAPPEPTALDPTAEAIANMAALYGLAWEAVKQELPELAAHPSALHAATATVLIGVQRRGK